MHSTFAKKSQASRRSVTCATSCTGQQAARASPGAFLPIVQAKLRIGAPNDKHEQEADHVADVVTRMPDPSTNSGPLLESASSPPVLRRTCEACERGGGLCPECDEEESLRRQPAEEDEDCLQTEPAAGHHPMLDPGVESDIQAVRGSGQPLSEPARRFFEPRFGRDFRGVRIHTDARAAETAAAIRARAFTIGQDVVFGANQYSPDTQRGRNLIAHELAHTVQQDRRTLQGWSSRSALSASLPANGSLRECAVNAPANRKFDVEVADGPALIRDVTAHEETHERDTGVIVSSVVERWEEAILEMKNDGFSVRAPDAAAATSLIFDEIRRRTGGPGSPCELGQAIEQGLVDAANTLHGQPGGDIRVQDFRVNWPSCSRVRVDWGAFPGTATRCAPATPDLACQPTPPLQVTARR